MDGDGLYAPEGPPPEVAPAERFEHLIYDVVGDVTRTLEAYVGAKKAADPDDPGIDHYTTFLEAVLERAESYTGGASAQQSIATKPLNTSFEVDLFTRRGGAVFIDPADKSKGTSTRIFKAGDAMDAHLEREGLRSFGMENIRVGIEQLATTDIPGLTIGVRLHEYSEEDQQYNPLTGLDANIVRKAGDFHCILTKDKPTSDALNVNRGAVEDRNTQDLYVRTLRMKDFFRKEKCLVTVERLDGTHVVQSMDCYVCPLLDAKTGAINPDVVSWAMVDSIYWAGRSQILDPFCFTPREVILPVERTDELIRKVGAKRTQKTRVQHVSGVELTPMINNRMATGGTGQFVRCELEVTLDVKMYTYS